EELTICSDQDIGLGDDWHDHIRAHLAGARVAVLLVSPAFLASKYVRSSELPVLLRNAKQRGVKIIPVIVRRCLFDETKFKSPDPKTGPEEFTLASLQAPNSPTKPLNGMTEDEQDEVLLKLARGLIKLVTAQAIALEPQEPVSDLNRGEVQTRQTKLQTSDCADIALLKQIGAAEEFETVKSVLAQRWKLTDILRAIDGRTDRVVEFIRDLHSFDAGIWRRSLAAYIASQIHIPPEDIIRLGFNTHLHWGSVTALLTLLRFTPPSKLNHAQPVLLQPANGRLFNEMDRQRPAILGLGYVYGERTIYGIIQDYHALTPGYHNEKLGPYAELAYLHCYISALTESDERSALRAFTEINQANEQNNHNFHFYDYADELQTLRPGKAVTLFRHLRDHKHHTALLALLARLGERPNPLLTSELIKLGRSTRHADVTAAALHAAAYTGAAQVVSEIAEAASASVYGATAALLLAHGVRRDAAGKNMLENALSGNQKDAPWLNDCRGNALWS